MMLMVFLSGLFGTLGTTLGLGGVGAAIAGVGVLALVGRDLRAILIAAGVGALAFVSAYGIGYLKCKTNDRAAYELSQAKANIAALEHQRDALQSTIERQNQLDADRAKEKAEDDTRISQLENIITAHSGNDACPRAATADELRGIQAIGTADGRDKAAGAAGKHHWLFRSHADPN